MPENRVQEVGAILVKIPEISHCYERKTVDGRWEYNLYTVMHARERESIVQRMVNEISEGIAINEYKILYSTRDLKRSIVSGSSSTMHSRSP